MNLSGDSIEVEKYYVRRGDLAVILCELEPKAISPVTLFRSTDQVPSLPIIPLSASNPLLYKIPST